MKATRMEIIMVLFTLASAGQAWGSDAVAVHKVETNSVIQDWLICGPFPNAQVEDKSATIKRQGYNIDYLAEIGGEAAARPKAGTTVTINGQPKQFNFHHSDEPLLNLRKIVDMEDFVLTYGYVELESAADRTVFIHFASDDGEKIYLNGQLVHESFNKNRRIEHEVIFEARLVKGTNSLLIKFDHEIGGYGAIVEVLDAEHHGNYVKENLAGNLDIELAQAGDLGKDLTLSPMPNFLVGGVLDGEPVKWTVLDDKGKVITEAEGVFQTPVTVSLPPAEGFVEIILELPNFGVSQSGYSLLAADRTAPVADALSQGDKWLDSHPGDKYAGWIAYRRSLLQKAMTLKGTDSNDSISEAFKLINWLGRIETDPLPKMRGCIEWAYQSAVDGSGQPFTLYIPDSYDPDKSYPFDISMHGSGGTHAKGQIHGASHPEDYFSIRLMGRARSGGYIKLGEVDVLESMAYVKSQWNIDEDRVHLGGSSMGGGGTFWLGSRHPDMFASGFARCGYGTHTQIANMIHLPLYSLHSDDDWVVSVALSRLAMQELAREGGLVTQHETTGFGHAVTKFTEGISVGKTWAKRQVRPEKVSRVRYTATDELACGAYWGTVIEWGPSSAPAAFDMRVSEDNSLFVDISNVGVLVVTLTDALVDMDKPLRVVINSAPNCTIPAELPGMLYISSGADGYTVSSQPPEKPAFRRHFPGGLPALYQGEPLMIVYGSSGSDSETKALREMAEVASRATNPGWREEDLDFPRHNMLFGSIPLKADVDVTAADIQRNNLILLGTAQQNSIVARIADALPVSITDGQVTVSDGMKYPFAGNAMGLLHYNPLASDRLVYWFAAGDPAAAKTGTNVTKRQRYTPAGCDFILARIEGTATVTQRNFKPDWTWAGNYTDSPLLPETMSSAIGYNGFLAGVLTDQTSSDFALFFKVWDNQMAIPGQSRWADLTASPLDDRPVVMEIRGSDLVRYVDKLKDARPGDEGEVLRFFPAINAAEITPERTYRIVCPNGWTMGTMCEKLKETPSQARLIDATVRQAIARYLARHPELTK